MNKSFYTFLVTLALASQSFAQFSQQNRDSVNRLSNEDHQLMMKKLEIEELRPGPSGNPEDPNAANSDESKASPYTSLPDPLAFDDGSKVKFAEDWEKRKAEIKEHFDREIYGRVPENVPDVHWEVTSTTDTVIGGYAVIQKNLAGRVDNSAYPEIDVEIELSLTTPATTGEPVPVIMELGWNWPSHIPRPATEGTPWQEQLLKKGWGYAVLIPTSLQADNGAGLREGIIGLVNKGQPRKLDDWGALRAWAWGASRALDYFETDPTVDAERVGIEGLSRYGKAAIVTFAYDPRFAIGFIGSSGAGGTKILRREYGEQVENLASSAEYHWFAPNFIKYAGPLTPNDLPVDAHHLIAMAAPRPVFISSGDPEVEGKWIDAKGMFLTAVHASPVYELFGKYGMGSSNYPQEHRALLDGEIAFREHRGGHTVVPNWPYFIEFADKYFSTEED
ncbi:acetylxylan esterase [Autumnicola psychrophila]|uniref:Acetylxylan esterase n=1 Tax=Autumnicola psychrophila TaxID=3075592 RepID=A0ABU3DVE5_9FLAO|nr:acetylxylan esterase [Zunongwangia sp. F225]MDT0687692.1 acetylxylan esterase [Zunongwangia sp. F225]